MTLPDGEGPLGRSRIERVHLRLTVDSESLEPFDLVRIVDADGDPELAEMALAGALNRLPDGTDVAEPFVYHARSAHALMLVVPPAARHREMAARHDLIRELESLDTVPAYAFDFRVILEPTALRTALEWHRASLPPLAEDVLDDEVADVIEVAQADEVDEADAVDDEDGVDQAEEADQVEDADEVEDAEPVEDADDVDDVDEVDVRGVGADLGELVDFSPALSRELSSYVVADAADELENVAHTEVEELRADAGVEDVEDDGDDVTEADADAADEPRTPRTDSVAAERFDLVEADWVTPDDDEDLAEDEPFTLDDNDAVMVPESYSTLLELPPELPHGVAPPADFASDPRRLRAGLFKDNVWLFARTRPGAFESDVIDAAVQYVKVADRSIALFAVADLTVDHGHIVRLATDLAAPAPRTLLSALAKRFVLSVAFFHEASTPVRCVQLGSARDTNVALLLTLPTGPGVQPADVETALAAAVAAPPPFHSTEHPFQLRPASTSAPDLRAEIRAVARWLEPTRLDRVRLGLGVPESVIFHVCQTVVESALATGIALPPGLMEWGTAAGIAEGPAAMVATQLTAFLALTKESERGGLRDTEVVSNWNALRSAASTFAVTIPAEVAEVLDALSAGESGYHPTALESLEPEALLELSRQANHRVAATAELLRRDPILHAGSVGLALRDMRREEVLAVVPALVRGGEQVVPTLLDTLGARKTYVRQAAALTLASLQAEAAVPELVKLVASESTTLWEEFARALAAFGELAETAVLDAVRHDVIPADRAALVLAYLAKASLGSSLDELMRSSDARIAAVALTVGPRIGTVDRHLREFYDASIVPTGPREFGKRLFRALHPDSSR